jgi:hypothetical protein
MIPRQLAARSFIFLMISVCAFRKPMISKISGRNFQ